MFHIKGGELRPTFITQIGLCLIAAVLAIGVICWVADLIWPTQIAREIDYSQRVEPRLQYHDSYEFTVVTEGSVIRLENAGIATKLEISTDCSASQIDSVKCADSTAVINTMLTLIKANSGKTNCIR